LDVGCVCEGAAITEHLEPSYYEAMVNANPMSTTPGRLALPTASAAALTKAKATADAGGDVNSSSKGGSQQAPDLKVNTEAKGAGSVLEWVLEQTGGAGKSGGGKGG